MRQSDAAIQAALAVTKGTVPGLILGAQWDLGGGRVDAARNGLLQAIKLAPQSLEANWELAELYRRTSQTALMEQQRSVTMNLVETSCGWLLHQAWRAISEGNAQAAAQALQIARQTDPSDGRVAAYSAVVSQMMGNTAEALAQRRVALAIEEAKLRLDSTNPAGVNLPRDPQQLALDLRLRDMLGAPLIAANPNAAITALEPGAVWAVRTPRAGRGTQLFGAMLPDPNAPKIPVPAPENAATLLGQVALNYGKALKAAGRTNDALAQFLLVVSFGEKHNVVGIGNGRGETNFADVAPARVVDDARLHAAKIRIEQRDCRGALDVLAFGYVGQISQSTNATPEVARERQVVLQQALACSGPGAPRAPAQPFEVHTPGPPHK